MDKIKIRDIKYKNKEKLYINNCKIIDTDPVKMYNTMYPIIDLEYLDSYITENMNETQKKEISDLFEVENILNKSDKTNCISVSFFCQNVNNTYINQYGTINYLDTKSQWYLKYYINLQKFINEFKKSIYYNTYKLRIYLEKQLSVFIPNLKDNNIEIYLMKYNSISAIPGMLWRYLVFDDKTIEIAHVFDIDESFNTMSTYINLFTKSNKTFGRVFINYFRDFRINKQNIMVNYPVVSGGMIGMRNKQLDINIKNSCINYILYRMLRSKSKYPNLENDTDQETIYNMPIDKHIYGWGGHWYMYGFDEKIWKHVFFPYFAKKGEIVSYSQNNVNKIHLLTDVNPIKIDYNYCKYYNNEFI